MLYPLPRRCLLYTSRVFDEAGTEIFRYADGESTEAKPNKIPYQTDRSGTFTLAPGQTAKFEYVGTGTAYEVTEDVYKRQLIR